MITDLAGVTGAPRRWRTHAVFSLLFVGAACPSDPSSDESGGSSTASPTNGSTPTGVSTAADATASASGDGTMGSGEPTDSMGSAGSTSTSADSTTNGEPTMSFFVTSEGNGPDGGNYGGLAGADARCQQLAADAGAGARTWHAYLSQAAIDGARVIHARDRIGAGPWHNAAGALVAETVEQLHQGGIDPALMLDEQSNPAGKGRPPGPEHDIITGTDVDGMLFVPARTCNNWTSSDPSDQVRVGHHDWDVIPMPITPDQHWADVHDSPCDAAGMAAVLGSGRLYCFAID